jgi:hypothetical protein
MIIITHTHKHVVWVNNIETFYCEMGECESEANAESSANFTTTMCKSMNCGCIKNTFLCTPEGDNVGMSVI